MVYPVPCRKGYLHQCRMPFRGPKNLAANLAAKEEYSVNNGKIS